MPPHSLTTFELEKYYQKESKFNGVYSRNNWLKIKGVMYVINLDEFKSKGTDLIALYMNGNNIIYFDSFGVEHILKKIKKFIRNKNIITNVYRIRAYDLIMCGYFCIEFIDFMLKGQSLLDYTNLFSTKKCEKMWK